MGDLSHTPAGFSRKEKNGANEGNSTMPRSAPGFEWERGGYERDPNECECGASPRLGNDDAGAGELDAV